MLMIKENRWIHILFYPLLMQLTLSIARVTVLQPTFLINVIILLTLYRYIRWRYRFQTLLFYKVAEEGDNLGSVH